MEDLIFVKKLRGGSFEAKSIAKMRNSRNILIRNKVRKELNEINRNYTKLGIVSREKEERLEGVAKSFRI